MRFAGGVTRTAAAAAGSSWPAAAACTAPWSTACSPSRPGTVGPCSCCTAWTTCCPRTPGAAPGSASASTRSRRSCRSPTAPARSAAAPICADQLETAVTFRFVSDRVRSIPETLDGPPGGERIETFADPKCYQNEKTPDEPGTPQRPSCSTPQKSCRTAYSDALKSKREKKTWGTTTRTAKDPNGELSQTRI